MIRSHHERALGADARARADVVENGAEHGERRRPFLDRIIQRKSLRHRQQAPKADEEDARDERHLNAGNGDDVKYAGPANEILGVFGQQVALAGHHGGGDRARIAFDDSIDPHRQGVAHAIDVREKTQREWRRFGRRHRLDSSKRVADRADARKKCVPREIIAARERRPRRRHQPRLEGDEVAGRKIRLAARRQPHAGGNDVVRIAFGARDAQNKTRAGPAQIHLLDEARQLTDADAWNDRRRDARRPPGARRKAEGDESERQKKRMGPRMAARKRGQDCKGGERAKAKRQRRFTLGREIEHDAAA